MIADALRVIFTNFWTWLGTFLIVTVISGSLHVRLGHDTHHHQG